MGEPEVFGAALRSYRLGAGMSLAGLAKIVHYSKGYLSKVENGVKTPSVDLARQCDVALGAGGALASLAARSRAASGSAPAYGAGTWVLRFGPDGGFSFHVAPDGDGTLAPAPSLRLARPDPPATGGSGSYPSLLATYHQLRRLGQEMGPGLVLPTLIAQTHAVSRLAAGDTGAGRRRLTLLAAHYAQHTGWMALEAGSSEVALWWTDRAAEMAREVGDGQLGAYARVRHALVALYRDDAAATVGLARQAQDHPRASARVRGLGALREAQGHALAGDEHACTAALERGTALLAAAGPDADGLPTVGSTKVTDVAAAVRGWCLVDLGRAAAAVDILGRELTRMPPGAHSTRARFGARLALAHAMAGEVEQACAVTAAVLDDAAVVDSATIRYDLRNLRRTLARWPAVAAVRTVYPSLTAALRAS